MIKPKERRKEEMEPLLFKTKLKVMVANTIQVRTCTESMESNCIQKEDGPNWTEILPPDGSEKEARFTRSILFL